LLLVSTGINRRRNRPSGFLGKAQANFDAATFFNVATSADKRKRVINIH
jgi:hypothetical protein